MKQWLVSVVEGRYRCWEDFACYGMVRAGHDAPPGAPLKRLRIGDELYAFLNGRGYVAPGEVTGTAACSRKKPKRLAGMQEPRAAAEELTDEKTRAFLAAAFGLQGVL